MAKKFLSDIELDAGLVDVNGNTGTSGQILSSTGTGVSWVSNASISEASESVHITVKNTSGATIAKGTPVYVTGETGNSGKIEVAPADASDGAKMPALGLLESNLANNAEGFCVQGGLLEGLSTATIDGTSTTANDTVYIKAGGGLTMTKPTGTNFIQNIAKVARVHASNGSLVVSSILRTNDVPTPLYIDHANQRVGIGKENPTSDLHINNDSTAAELRISYPGGGSGYGGGGSIIIEGGSNDYVYGSIDWVNGANRDGAILYGAAGRNMNFQVNERSISTNGYFRFYSGGSKIAEITPLGVYGNVFYDLNDTTYYLDPSSTSTALNAPLGSARVKDVYIGNLTSTISNKVSFNSGGVYHPGLYFDGSNPKFAINTFVSSIFHDSYHPNADTWTTARTITIGNTGKSVNGSANVFWSLAEIGAAASSHNHDDRYYTENEMQTFFNRGYISNQSASNLAIGWYTIATNTGNRALGEFQIWDIASSRHQSVLFNASHHYGADGSNDITVLANSRFSTDVFRYIRIKENSTYDGAALQVYIDNSTNSVRAAITGANAQESGWVLKDWIADATDPGDVGNYSSFTSKCQVDLDNIQNGGIATTGNIFSGGALTQYRNLTTADEGSGNGLDADTLDGQHASAFLTSYTETDTLDSVADRGSTTNQQLISTNPSGFRVDSGSSARIEIDSNNDWSYVRLQDNSVVYWDIASYDGGQLELRPGGGGANRTYFDSSGNSFSEGSKRAPRFYDINDTSYYLDPASTSELNNVFLDDFIYHRGDTDTYMGFPGADTIRFVTNSTERMEISNGGVVFGGGANAAKPVHIATTDQGTARLRIENTNAGGDTFDLVAGVHNVTQEGFSIYQENANATRLRMDDDGNVKIGSGAPSEKLDVDGSITSNATIWTGYDSGVANSVSCSGWFRSSGSTGWYNATYGGGIYMADSTWVRAYNNKKFFADNTIESNSGMYAPIFYDRNNTNYRFNGDASKDGVDLTSSGNYAVHVLGTISGGHRKHGNLETPEMEWSVGGSTDLNWKKLCDVVIYDASYSGWGAEIEITNFSGNFGSSTYSGGELFKGALSVYHWGGTGVTTETAYANIPYEMRNHVRWYKVNETGQNRYQLQVKSPGNYQQVYIKVKPGIGNQVADIISYANDTNGLTSGGTAYISTQYNNFNHEFAGGIWTNDNRSIGWKNAFGTPSFINYYGAITTNTTLYVGGSSSTQDLYCDQVRSNSVLDKSNSAYYFDGGNTGDSIRVAGDVVAYYSSDERLKDKIKPIENALEKVNAISGVTFEWNEKSHKTTGKKDVGVVAQEIEAVLPELVETRTNGYKAVDYQKLTAVLIESVKELTAKVEALESKQCNCN